MKRKYVLGKPYGLIDKVFIPIKREYNIFGLKIYSNDATVAGYSYKRTLSKARKRRDRFNKGSEKPNFFEGGY